MTAAHRRSLLMSSNTNVNVESVHLKNRISLQAEQACCLGDKVILDLQTCFMAGVRLLLGVNHTSRGSLKGGKHDAIVPRRNDTTSYLKLPCSYWKCTEVCSQTLKEYIMAPCRLQRGRRKRLLRDKKKIKKIKDKALDEMKKRARKQRV